MIREYIYFVDDNPNGTSGMTEEEIIRCKDCKYWDKYKVIDVGCCLRIDYYTATDDFCSYGERIESEE